MWIMYIAWAFWLCWNTNSSPISRSWKLCLIFLAGSFHRFIVGWIGWGRKERFRLLFLAKLVEILIVEKLPGTASVFRLAWNHFQALTIHSLFAGRWDIVSMNKIAAQGLLLNFQLWLCSLLFICAMWCVTCVSWYCFSFLTGEV